MSNSSPLTSRLQKRKDQHYDGDDDNLKIDKNQNNNIFFVVQKCVMKFASWTYDGFQVDMILLTIADINHL